MMVTKMTGDHCICESEGFDERIKASILDDDTAMDLSDLFKLFGDSTRLRILWVLKGNEMCVDAISTAIGVSVSAVSHQLKALKGANLVRSRRDGKWIYYSLCDEHVESLLAIAMEHLTEEDR